MAAIREFHHKTQIHGLAREGTTDLYCICVLRALDETQKLVPQASEIAECEWLDLDYFLNLKYYNKPETLFYTMSRTVAKVAMGKSRGLASQSLDFGIKDYICRLYADDLHVSNKL